MSPKCDTYITDNNMAQMNSMIDSLVYHITIGHHYHNRLTSSSLVRETKQLLGTMSLTNSRGCCTIRFIGSCSLTLVRSTSSAPYRRLPNDKSELYNTCTPDNYTIKYTILVNRAIFKLNL